MNAHQNSVARAGRGLGLAHRIQIQAARSFGHFKHYHASLAGASINAAANRSAVLVKARSTWPRSRLLSWPVASFACAREGQPVREDGAKHVLRRPARRRISMPDQSNPFGITEICDAVAADPTWTSESLVRVSIRSNPLGHRISMTPSKLSAPCSTTG